MLLGLRLIFFWGFIIDLVIIGGWTYYGICEPLGELVKFVDGCPSSQAWQITVWGFILCGIVRVLPLFCPEHRSIWVACLASMVVEVFMTLHLCKNIGDAIPACGLCGAATLYLIAYMPQGNPAGMMGTQLLPKLLFGWGIGDLFVIGGLTNSGVCGPLGEIIKFADGCPSSQIWVITIYGFILCGILRLLPFCYPAETSAWIACLATMFVEILMTVYQSKETPDAIPALGLCGAASAAIVKFSILPQKGGPDMVILSTLSAAVTVALGATSWSQSLDMNTVAGRVGFTILGGAGLYAFYEGIGRSEDDGKIHEY